MKKYFIFFLWLFNSVTLNSAAFLKERLDDVGKDSDFHENSIQPGKESVLALKKILAELIEKLESTNENKPAPESHPKVKHSKFKCNPFIVEVKMPEKGKELKVKHGLNIKDISNISVNIVNGREEGMIIRSQVDLISQKVLFNWYCDHENFVVIRANNVRHTN